MTDDLLRESDEVRVDNTEVQDDAELGGGGSETVIGQAQGAQALSRPAEGQTVAVDYGPGQTFILNFDPGAALVLIDGNDLILGFDDNGDGTPDSRLVFENLASAEGADAGLVFQVGDAQIGSAILVNQALALGEDSDNTLETAADADAQGTGATEYVDTLGDAIDLLAAQGVIDPTALEFGLIDPDIDPLDEEPLLFTGSEPPEDPIVSLTLPSQVDCIEEDSTTADADNVVTVNATPEGDDLLTEIVITGFQADWTYDFTGLGGAGITVDDSVAGQVTITFATPANAPYTGTFAVQPPADSDVDHPTLTATATVQDPADPTLTATAEGTLDIAVDANADGAADGLSVFIDVNDSGDPDDEFGSNETGTVEVSASFGDFTDGSEIHTVLVELPDGFTVVQPLPATPAGVTAVVNGDGNVEFTVATGTESFAGYVFEVTAPDNVPDGTVFQFSATAQAQETTTGDVECDDSDADNIATVVAEDEVPGGEVGVPEVGLVVQTPDECIDEDTQADVQITANVTTPGDQLTEIVVTAPADWVLDAVVGGEIAGVAGGGSNVLTLTLNPGVTAFDELIQATPPADSDVDATFNVAATAVDGAETATGDDDFNIDVDAIADGVADGLSVDIEVADSTGETPENDAFEIGETGTVTVSASFGDFTDGSETHTVLVEIPDGFSVGQPLPATPAGVTALVNGDGNVEFTVATGTESFSNYEFSVTNDSAADGTASFSATARAEETPTDNECDPTDNVATVTDEAEVTVANVTPPTVELDVPGDDDCIEEDSTLADADNVVSVDVTPQGDDLLSEIVITGLQADWTYDLSGLDTDGAGTDVTVDDSVAGQVTITFATPANAAYAGSFAVQPPADSDVDHPTLTATATVVDPADANLTTSRPGRAWTSSSTPMPMVPPTGFRDLGFGLHRLTTPANADSVFELGETGTVTVSADLRGLHRTAPRPTRFWSKFLHRTALGSDRDRRRQPADCRRARLLPGFTKWTSLSSFSPWPTDAVNGLERLRRST